jgi:polysaccharide export outer membrane protein
MAGEFGYPMILPIVEGSTRVLNALRAAGGFTKLAAIREATLVRAGGAEQLQDLEFERLKRVPVADMSKDEYQYFKMKSRERTGRMQVDFVAVLANASHPDNILLEDGDVITAPRVRRFVQVSGQVADPGNVLFEPGLTVQDYVARAGGYAWNARQSGTTLIRARSGEWVRDPDRDLRLEPGDVLWVPEKPDRDFWALFRDGMLVAAQAATVVLLAQQIAK